MVKTKPVTLSAANTNKTNKSGSQSTRRESLEQFVGLIPKLSGVIVDTVNTQKSGHYGMSKIRIAHYLDNELQSGGDIKHTIINIIKFIIPKPIN